MNDSTFASAASDVAYLWQDYRPTPLIELPRLACRMNVERLFVKVEAERPLGNFKALGGMIAGLRALARAAGAPTIRDLLSSGCASGSLPQLICASDGNHGLAVAAAASRAGTRAVIYLPANASPVRAARIEACGGEVIRVAGVYDDAVDAAASAAARGEGVLTPDTSADPDDLAVRDVMAGYTVLAQELVVQLTALDVRPSHLFIQAGVGGLAAAMAQGVRQAMRNPQKVLVVEPEAAACVASALRLGRPVRIEGALHTAAAMLSCGLASAAALAVLQRHHVRSVLVREDQLHAAVEVLRADGGPDTTASGAAGLAGLLHVAALQALRAEHALDGQSVVLLIITEGCAASGD